MNPAGMITFSTEPRALSGVAIIPTTVTFIFGEQVELIEDEDDGVGTKLKIEPRVVKLFMEMPYGPVMGTFGVTPTEQMFEMFIPTPPS